MYQEAGVRKSRSEVVFLPEFMCNNEKLDRTLGLTISPVAIEAFTHQFRLPLFPLTDRCKVWSGRRGPCGSRAGHQRARCSFPCSQAGAAAGRCFPLDLGSAGHMDPQDPDESVFFFFWRKITFFRAPFLRHTVRMPSTSWGWAASWPAGSEDSRAPPVPLCPFQTS